MSRREILGILAFFMLTVLAGGGFCAYKAAYIDCSKMTGRPCEGQRRIIPEMADMVF